MKNDLYWLALCTLLFVPCISAEAQQPTKIPRIGYLAGASRSAIAFRTEAFRQGLRELGYVEGKNITIEYRYAEGNFRRQKELAADLMRLKVDVIVTSGPASTRAAKETIATIPIIMTFDSGVQSPPTCLSSNRPSSSW